MTHNLNRAVFLDRDGVINKAFVIDGRPYSPKNLSEVVILPGVPESLIKLKINGFKIIVITNQPDVARGKNNISSIEEINNYLLNNLAIDEINTCYHDNNQCNCRKPNPNLILNAAKFHSITLNCSYMIGDRWSDIEAGQRAGCKTIFIDYKYDEKQPSTPDYISNDLYGAMKIILKEHT